MHYTAEDFHSSLKTLTDEHVSAHYLLPAHPQREHGKPTVYRLVPEAMRAWHAGTSAWRGRSNLNDTSIGIEIVNKGFTRSMLFTHWQPYTAEQIAVLIPLSRDIVQRYGIQPQDVVGHSDIAPQRKQDPGPLFPGGSWPRPVSAPGRTNETCSVCWRGAIVMRRYRWCRCSKSWRVTAMRSTRHGMRGSSAMWWRRFRCTSGPTMCAASRMQRVKRLSMRCW